MHNLFMKIRAMKFICLFTLVLLLTVSGCASLTDIRQDYRTAIHVDPLWDEIYENDYESVSSGDMIVGENKSISVIIYKRPINEEATLTTKSSFIVAFFDTTNEIEFPLKIMLAIVQ